MSPAKASLYQGGPGFPRVSGDEPLRRWSEAAQCAFSPRERG